MSTTGSENYNQQFNFFHFDQESDFGIETEDGQRIKKKKRPGRKPNPPTVEKRRAQNRASQRAYRERENQRKQEHEKERMCFLKEIQALKRKLAQTQYEANYLRAMVLHFTLTMLAEKGSVPHLFVDEDAANTASYDIKQTTSSNPPLLEIILENKRIVDLTQALYNICQVKNAVHHKKKFYKFPQDYVPLNSESQQIEATFPTQPLDPKLGFNQQQEDEALLADTLATQEEDEMITTEQNQLTIHKKPLKGVILQPPSLKTADDFVHMPPLQAVHITKLQLKIASIMGPNTQLALAPTTLQKLIPHDLRIDYIPGPSLRDRMILFQDYFDVDECFQYLTQSTVFTGGDVRVPRNWRTGSDYTSKFWFCAHEFIDDPGFRPMASACNSVLELLKEKGSMDRNELTSTPL
ncbi:hypothetical protein RMCBS344292_11942 [Rhizopus microsporus]|nr:hypothetical protein RMCBS344292_11942 [Rhizopus microsporus]